jgi:hypothetical protein
MFATYLEEMKSKVRVPLILLYALSFFRTIEKFRALKLASRSYGLVRSSRTKRVADYMANEHTLSLEEDVDPTSMKGYKYLVTGEEKGQVRVKAPLYLQQLENIDEVITTNKIWECRGQLLSSTDTDGRLKDICLSFALCKLLLRRFAGYSFAESSQPKTWRLVEQLSRSKRAFRVIEVELGFLYDIFYTKYPVIFADQGIPMLLIKKSIEILLVAVSCWNIVVTTLETYKNKKNTPENDDSHLNLFTVNGHNLDALVTTIVIIAILLMEVVQYLVIIFFSDWARVKWLCWYVKKSPPLASSSCTWHDNSWVVKIMQIVCHKRWLKPWQRKLGQYSLLESFDHNPSKLLYNRLTTEFIDKARKGQKESPRIKLPEKVERAILDSLSSTHGRPLRNGEASLRRNEVENEFSWACRLETQTHVIMVWHIATSLCEIGASEPISTREEAQMQRKSEHFIVATSLSKYCAYLVAFAPRLLPDHTYTAETIFEQVVDEAREHIQGNSLTDMYNHMIKKISLHNNPDNAKSIVERSVVLARRLIARDEQRWKILAEFWAEMMLFVAPSDDVTAHAEYLARGGEFVTHLWALLSHAGIVNRDSASDGIV